jgi:hypothetical protein
MQSSSQKEDMKEIFKLHTKSYKSLDYISCWFLKAALYIKKSSSKAAFVSTSSICQGDQVSSLWGSIYSLGISIYFAHKNFLWSNNAKNKAAVYCSIIGITAGDDDNYLYESGAVKKVANVNPYLSDSADIFIERRSEQISGLPKMEYGNKAVDGGNLILTKDERDKILTNTPEAERYIKLLSGSSEFIRGNVRYAIWIEDDEVEEALSIPDIFERVEGVRDFRLSSRDAGANKLASRPHQFRDFKSIDNNAIVVPRVSSDRREYLPVGFLNSDYVILDSAQAIYEAPLYIFGILSSKIHLSWVKAVSGRLKNDFRYSSVISWNTFPIPALTEDNINALNELSMKIIEERENYFDRSISDLYDPDQMPTSLLKAHHELDSYMESLYTKKRCKGDEDRLKVLFDLYKKVTGKGHA